MNTSKLTSKGQITVPRAIREKLGVRAGDTLVYEVEGNTVRVRRAEPFDLPGMARFRPRWRGSGIRRSTTRTSMVCDAFEVVAVPFPFTDSAKVVKRPALVLSRAAFNEHGYTVLAMITDQRNEPWPLDVSIDFRAAGLKMPSVVRMKFFTLDNQLIAAKIGRLTPADRRKALASLRALMPMSEAR